MCLSAFSGPSDRYRLDALSFLLLAACVVAAALVHQTTSASGSASTVDGGLLGLSLLYVVQLSGLGQWAVRQSAELEAQMVRKARVQNMKATKGSKSIAVRTFA